MEQNISKDIQERLDKINWQYLNERYGITRDSVTQNPFVASQLAYGQMTDLVPGSNADITGVYSLRAYPVNDGQEYKVKVYTMEKPKTENDTLFLYKQPITSESVRAALLEKTDWQGRDNTRKYGYANANGGRPITIELDGRKQQFLVSIHQPTNRVVGMPVEHVKSFFMDKEGNSRGKSMYGVTFTDEQVKALCEGKAIRLEGCLDKSGQTFNCYAQFDAAQRQVVPCHPGWLKQALQTGTDLGIGNKNANGNEQEQKQKAVQEQQKQQNQDQEKSRSRGPRR